MIEVNRQGEVWVFAEQEGGALAEVPLELLGKGRELADTLGVPLAAVLLPPRTARRPAARLGQYGADKVYLVEHDLLRHYQTAAYARVVCELVDGVLAADRACTARRRSGATSRRPWPAP